MAYIEVGSKKLYVEEYGKEHTQTIVYFHGGPGASCRGFENQATALSEKYHVVCFDQCGVSRSDAIPQNEPFGMTEHIKQIDNMREILGISSWTVLGHSYGGILACLYAYIYPQNSDAVVYIGTAWDVGLSTRAQAAYLIPYFKRINSREGMKNCIELITSNSDNREELHNYYMTSIMPLVKNFSECLFLRIRIDEFKKIRLSTLHNACPQKC